MATDIATLGIAVDASGVPRAEQALDRLTASAANTEKQTHKASAATQNLNTQLKATTDAANKQAQVMRMLAPQLTDITVGLTTGQSPFMILMQQGGQLKDQMAMMGISVGQALKAVGTTVLGLVNPFTLAAGAGLLLAAAANSGANESLALNRAIILSGNAAGVTSSQLQVMASHVSSVVGTTGAAAEALELLVSSGKIDAQYLERYATLTVRLDKLGVEAKDTAADLASLGRDPVSAVLKLNDAINFLDVTTYLHIKNLQDLGKLQEAQEVAQQAYAQAMETRAGRLEGSLGYIERGWNAVKGAAAGAWDAMKGVGRDKDVDQQLAEVQKQLQYAKTGDLTARSGLPGLIDEERRLLRIKEIREGSAAAEASRANATQAATQFEALREQSMSRQERLAQSVTKATELGTAAGMDQAAILKVIAGLSYENAQRAIETQIDRLNTLAELAQVRAKSVESDLEVKRKTGAMNEMAYIAAVADADVKALQARRSATAQQIALKAQERDSEQAVAALRNQLEVQDAEIALRKKQRDNDLAMAQHAREQAIRGVIAAQYEQNQQDNANAINDAYQATNQAIGAQNAWKQSLKDANAEIDFEATLLGKTAEEQKRLNDQHRIDLLLRERKRAIDALPPEIDAGQRAALIADAEQTAADAIKKLDTKDYVEKWKTANQAVGETLFDVLTGNAQSASDRIKKIFKEMVLRPMLQPIANGLTNMIMGAPGGAGGLASMFGQAGSADAPGGFLGGLGGIAGSAAGLAGMGSAIGTAFTAGSTSVGVMAGSIAGGGGMMGGLAAAAGAIPVAGWIALGAMAIGSLLSKKGGGPKTESGYGLGVPNRGDPSTARQAAQAIQQQYKQLTQGLGIDGGSLDLGVFSAADPRGTAQTQLALNASLNGRSIYSRADRTGGIENVGRSQEELQAAMAEDSTRAVFAAIKATDGLSESMRRILSTADAYSSSLEEINAAMARATKAENERKSLEEQIFQLSHDDAANKQHLRDQELKALDESNRALALRVYALQDEKEAQALAQQAIEKAADSARQAAEFINDFKTSIKGYLDSQTSTGSGLLTPSQQLSNALLQFNRQADLARSGDKDAAQSITQYADRLAEAQKVLTASGTQTVAMLEYIRDTLEHLPSEMAKPFSSSDVAGEAAAAAAQAVAQDTQDAAQAKTDAIKQENAALREQVADLGEKVERLIGLVAQYAQGSLDQGSRIVENTAKSAQNAVAPAASAYSNGYNGILV